ncbi:GerAB/ArcD/ProY family transporter [Paenibacillus turpanensis]|uniref:GerAB/ArcD/ProY family transporter n=1 Tax=Paenibacillus turpanensis TaxID=2689078 RepID=UPI00140993D1|nr:GerAB/ArcD/ProY family transporter [Paenibacillus turpanensis]
MIQISNGMFVALIINMIYAKAIGVTQGIMAREVGGDIWIATVFATLQGAGVIALTALVLRRAPDKSILEQVKAMLGVWPAKLLALLLMIFFLGAYAGYMITLVYHLMDYFLPEAPVILFVLLGTLVGMYGIYQGFEVISRMAFLGVFSLIILNILILLGSYQQFDIREMMPVFQSGVWPTLKASLHNDTDWAATTIMAALVLPWVKKPEVWVRSGVFGVISAGLMVLVFSILEVGVITPEMTAQYIISCMQMARSAEIGIFIHRYEMLMIIFFATSALIQIMTCLLLGANTLQYVVGLKKGFRPLILPVGALFFGFSYWIVADHNRAMQYLSDYWMPFAVTVGYALPVLFLGLSLVLGKKLRGEGQGKSGSLP